MLIAVLFLCVGNGRRSSHNPPEPMMLDIYDRVGMVVMDENREFGDALPLVKNMKDMVLRDRNHPCEWADSSKSRNQS